MQIGEFAKICKTKITVLRHYDKEGLLKPDYIDRFSGYRYYSKEQIKVYLKIAALKKAGFSLAEIKTIISEQSTNEMIIDLFEKKKSELQKTLLNLSETKSMLLGDEQAMNIRIIETENGFKFRTSKIAAENQLNAFKEIDKAVLSGDYQRISGFRSYGTHMNDEVEIECDAVKLGKSEIVLSEDINIPFENDETVIGKWQAVGEYAVKEDFYAQRAVHNSNREIYFLPRGERYWCYGWSKGKLIVEDGDSSYINNFTTEMYNGQRYMFIDWKSYNYRHGGKTTVFVFKQLDNRAYTASEIARKDNINIPFENDSDVLGKWRAIAYCLKKEDFNPENSDDKKLYFSEVDFKPNGEIVSYYGYGKDIISSRNMQEWTKGTIKRKWNQTACAYEIKTINSKEYLFMEWKSGDYRWGGFDTDYYIFERE